MKTDANNVSGSVSDGTAAESAEAVDKVPSEQGSKAHIPETGDKYSLGAPWSDRATKNREPWPGW